MRDDELESAQAPEPISFEPMSFMIIVITYNLPPRLWVLYLSFKLSVFFVVVY